MKEATTTTEFAVADIGRILSEAFTAFFRGSKKGEQGKIIFGTYAGSRAYNLNLATSDTDLVGVFVAPTKSFFLLEEYEYPKIITTSTAPGTKNCAEDIDITLLEVGELLKQAIKGDPHAIEVLYCKENYFAEPAWDIITQYRDELLSKEMFKNYLGAAAGLWKTVQHRIKQGKGMTRIYYSWMNFLQIKRLIQGEKPEIFLQGEMRDFLMDIRAKTKTADSDTIQDFIKQIDMLKGTCYKLYKQHLNAMPNLDTTKIAQSLYQIRLNGNTAAVLDSGITTFILYHCPCVDGAFAAYAAHLYFQQDLTTKVKYIPHQTYSRIDWQKAQLFDSNSIVYLLDYIGPRELLDHLLQTVKRVILIDHHATAHAIVEDVKKISSPDNFEIAFDLDKSAATLAYDYFKSKRGGELIDDPTKRARLELVYKYVEDNDLARWALPNSKQFRSGLGAKQISFNFYVNYYLFQKLGEIDVDDTITSGVDIAIEEEKIIDAEIKNAFKIYLGGKKEGNKNCCFAVMTKSPHLRTRLGKKLAKKSAAANMKPIGAIVYELQDIPDKDLYFKVSLRSLPNTDTLSISSQYNGGGHDCASAFLILRSEFDSWKATPQKESDNKILEKN